MRAALLPTPGDPFVVSYWLRNFERVWMDEVDELHVLVNGGDPSLLQPMFDRVADAKASGRIIASYEPGRVGHGEALRRLLCGSDVNEVVLVEDDAYVRTPGAVRTSFEWRGLVPGLVLGSPRGGYSPELERPAWDRWGKSFGPDGSVGYGIWPCFLFSEREALLAVADEFAARSWPAGSTIPGLDYTCATEMHTDTMTAAAFMLRDRHPVVHVPQYKEIDQKALIAERNAPWFHAGGLSNLDPRQGFVGLRPNIGGSNEGRDWASRVWWWRRCLDTSGPELEYLHDDYRRRLDQLVEEAGIAEQVAEWEDVYPACITWDETP